MQEWDGREKREEIVGRRRWREFRGWMGLGFASGKVCMLACGIAMGSIRWVPYHAS